MHRPSAPARRSSVALAALATLALAALALLPLAGLSGCERAPTPPAWDNPFDPLGPEGGDPLRLRANVAGNLISLSWHQPQGMGITEYAISQAVHPDSAWSGLAVVTHTTADENIHLVNDPTPTQAHWYRIQALDGDGAASLSSYATPAGVTLGPRVILNQGGTTTATRQLTVKVVVSRGTTLRVALGPAYTVETTHAAAAPGDTAFIAVDAGAAAQGDTVRVRVIATDGGAYTSVATTVRARVDFSPDFTLKGGGTVASSRTVALMVPPSGILQMRFAGSEAGLAGAAWVPGAATHTQLLLSTGTGPQEDLGRVRRRLRLRQRFTHHRDAGPADRRDVPPGGARGPHHGHDRRARHPDRQGHAGALVRGAEPGGRPLAGAHRYAGHDPEPGRRPEDHLSADAQRLGRLAHPDRLRRAAGPGRRGGVRCADGWRQRAVGRVAAGARHGLRRRGGSIRSGSISATASGAP